MPVYLNGFNDWLTNTNFCCSKGEDCTNAFEDVGHSSSAYEMLKDFYIGDLVESKEKSCSTSTSNSKSTCCAPKKMNDSSSTPKNLPVIVAAVIVGAAIAYNAFLRK